MRQKFRDLGRKVIEIEAKAVADLVNRIDDQFAKACELLLACTGRIVVLGIGKSGHIGNKIAATLASTGSPAFFVHAAEASHGDLGMITKQDIVLAISNSGETNELVTILPLIKLLNIPLIALSGNATSTLAKQATVYLDVSVAEEACPLGLAPTSSTTATMAMGDALAISLLEARGFTADDFAKVHPKGTLGLRLLLHVRDVMHTGDKIPSVLSGAKLTSALLEISQKRLGITTIVDQNNKLVGIYTDGDLRRTVDRGLDLHQTIIDEVMSTNCKTISADILASEALNIMETYKITALVVTNQNNNPVGIVHIHDILIAGMK